MRRIIRSCITTFALVSRIPVPFRYRADFSYTGFFLPLVGIAVGLLDSLIFILLATFVRDIFLLAVLILTAQYLAFNLFHFDGLLDTADSLLPHVTRARRLAILKDVHVGTFALFCGVLYIIVKIHFLSKCLDLIYQERAVIIVLFSFPITGRIAADLSACLLKPAQAEGLGASMGRVSVPQLLGGTGAALAPCIGAFFLWPFPVPLLLCFTGSLAASVLISIPFKHLLGGITGDGLGSAIELGELLHLVILASLSSFLFGSI